MPGVSEEIVRKLLENEIDPKAFAMQVSGSLDDDTLRRFKSSATAYIKWISADAYDPQTAADIASCGSFQEVATILSYYDEAGSGIGFLDMIDQGYFT
jgi:hypothetical protein